MDDVIDAPQAPRPADQDAPLIIFGAESDDLVCVDDVCVPGSAMDIAAKATGTTG